MDIFSLRLIIANTLIRRVDPKSNWQKSPLALLIVVVFRKLKSLSLRVFVLAFACYVVTCWQQCRHRRWANHNCSTLKHSRQLKVLGCAKIQFWQCSTTCLQYYSDALGQNCCETVLTVLCQPSGHFAFTVHRRRKHWQSCLKLLSHVNHQKWWL